MNLIRVLAQKVESLDGDAYSSDFQVDGYSQKQIGFHCQLMVDAGLIAAKDCSDLEENHLDFHIERLTPKGYDFVETSRNDTIWKKAMGRISDTVGGTTIEILIDYLKKLAAQALGG